jgi:hypothetical protein
VFSRTNLVSGLESVSAGLISATPYLLFVPVNDGDVPTPGGDVVLLDG